MLAPFPVALFQAITISIWPKIERGGVFAHPSSMFVLICLLFYVLQATTGAAGAIYLRRRGLVSLAHWVCTGLITLALPFDLVVLWGASDSELRLWAIVYNIALFTAGGAVAGLVFWAIAIRGRASPERAAGITGRINRVTQDPEVS